MWNSSVQEGRNSTTSWKTTLSQCIEFVKDNDDDENVPLTWCYHIKICIIRYIVYEQFYSNVNVNKKKLYPKLFCSLLKHAFNDKS